MFISYSNTFSPFQIFCYVTEHLGLFRIINQVKLSQRWCGVSDLQCLMSKYICLNCNCVESVHRKICPSLPRFHSSCNLTLAQASSPLKSKFWNDSCVFCKLKSCFVNVFDVLHSANFLFLFYLFAYIWSHPVVLIFAGTDCLLVT